jgi:hypothetical protein
VPPLRVWNTVSGIKVPQYEFPIIVTPDPSEDAGSHLGMCVTPGVAQPITAGWGLPVSKPQGQEGINLDGNSRLRLSRRPCGLAAMRCGIAACHDMGNAVYTTLFETPRSLSI